MISSRRRTTELTLVALAALITVAAYTLVALGRTATLPANVGPFLGIVVALLLVPHIANRFLAKGADGVLLPLAALLNGIGYVFIARIDSRLASKQAGWTIVGVAAYVITLIVVKRVGDLARYKWTLGVAGLGLLMLPFVPGIGRNINNARIWIRVGPFSFQPGEMAKIALTLFFAGYLVERRELLAMATKRVGPFWLPEPRHFGPVVAGWVVSLAIMTTQQDLGSSLLFFALFVILIWVATERASYLVAGLFLFAGGAYFAWSQLSRVKIRVTTWLDPWADAQDTGFQLIQATYAMAGGGTTGTGLGLGDPTRIPVVQNDFIFAAISEELGLVGGTAILISFILMIGAGLRIASRTERPFEKLVATGLTAIIGIQAFIIIGGVTRVVPLTGVALPFVSYGGSSLLANYILLAILMRISDGTASRLGETSPRRPKRKGRRDQEPEFDDISKTVMVPVVSQ
jgi:cell division protein FtsW (lipid II flippase)